MGICIKQVVITHPLSVHSIATEFPRLLKTWEIWKMAEKKNTCMEKSWNLKNNEIMYHGKNMEFCYEMPVWISKAPFFSSLARQVLINIFLIFNRAIQNNFSSSENKIISYFAI